MASVLVFVRVSVGTSDDEARTTLDNQVQSIVSTLGLVEGEYRVYSGVMSAWSKDPLTEGVNYAVASGYKTIAVNTIDRATRNVANFEVALTNMDINGIVLVSALDGLRSDTDREEMLRLAQSAEDYSNSLSKKGIENARLRSARIVEQASYHARSGQASKLLLPPYAGHLSRIIDDDASRHEIVNLIMQARDVVSPRNLKKMRRGLARAYSESEEFRQWVLQHVRGLINTNRDNLIVGANVRKFIKRYLGKGMLRQVYSDLINCADTPQHDEYLVGTMTLPPESSGRQIRGASSGRPVRRRVMALQPSGRQTAIDRLRDIQAQRRSTAASAVQSPRMPLGTIRSRQAVIDRLRSSQVQRAAAASPQDDSDEASDMDEE